MGARALDHDRLIKQLLTRSEVDPARRELVSGFIGAYLRLTMEEERVFETELDKVESRHRKEIMEIVTGWMERGLQQGLQ
jgi:hypothetical protein